VETLCLKQTHPSSIPTAVWQSVTALTVGESIRCRIELQAPGIEGEVRLTITMLQELIVWFDADARPYHQCQRNCRSIRIEAMSLQSFRGLHGEWDVYREAPLAFENKEN